MKHCHVTVCALIFATVMSVSSRASAEELTVFAASSMNRALTEIGKAFEAANSEHTVTFVFASSSTLARHILAGAPAHIYVSANDDWMKETIINGAIDEDSVNTIAGNTLVLIEHFSNGLATDMAITSERQKLDHGFNLGELLDTEDSRLSMGDPAHVPVGKYGREALQFTGLWDAVKDQLAPMPDAVSALNLVARNETAYGVVYYSDTYGIDTVRIVGFFPDMSHAAIRYQAAPVQQNITTGTLKFMDYLLSSAAKQIFRTHYFCLDC